MKRYHIILWLVPWTILLNAQSWDLTRENIDRAIADSAASIHGDPFRPAFHLTPPAGCMGDPNGGIYHDGWYHIFYGLQPFAYHPGAWYWAHARSRDLLHWEHVETGLTPAFDLGLHAIGSGSTIITGKGKRLAFYSQGRGGAMEFWRAEFTNRNLSGWSHRGKNPVLTLEHPGLPPFDRFWRDPFVFSVEGSTFLIACADLFEENLVRVPVFEAGNDELTEWKYRGTLLEVPKHRYRNLEVPEIRQLGDQWIFLASTDAPRDRVVYFLGDLDLERCSFSIESEGVIDYSGHYYAQETIPGPEGQMVLMAWIPGWDREWLPYYMNEPLKNANPRWNGCFAIPRVLSLENGQLIQQPVPSIRKLRSGHYKIDARELHVSNAMTATEVIEEFQGSQVEILVRFNLHHAAFCGMNILADREGKGGLPIVWSGNQLNVDGVRIPMEEWNPGDPVEMQVFVDKKIVEVFVNGGRYCITRQLAEEHVKGEHVAFTTLGGTAKLLSFEAWKLDPIHQTMK